MHVGLRKIKSSSNRQLFSEGNLPKFGSQSQAGENSPNYNLRNSGASIDSNMSRNKCKKRKFLSSRRA